MLKTLLIELNFEELPALPFLKVLPNIEKKWECILEKYSLQSEFEFFYTPRRLVFWHKEFLLAQADKTQEFFGPPLSISYENNDKYKPTKAALGFAKKCGVGIADLKSKTAQNGEVLYLKKEIKGSLSASLLGAMIEEFISSLNFSKSMRWGEGEYEFIRPLRNLLVLLDDKLVPSELFGVKSQSQTFVHRMASFESKSLSNSKEYFKTLDENGVILFQDKRKDLILEGIKDIEKVHKIKVEIDEALLAELVAITEYPKPLLGTFSKDFLRLPKEVIISSMKEHQRYFAVYKKADSDSADNELENKFIVVSNAFTKDYSLVVKGNEKVLCPRLADAMFFYENDLKNGLDIKGLKDIIFVDKLGTLYDKMLREVEIAKALANTLDFKEKELLLSCVKLSKADLLSEMVCEFTELQGLMGYYYAKVAKEDEKLCLGLKEQYYPLGENAKLPSSVFSSLVAISNKLDSILSLFSINKIPSGSKDPFALRRAASSIIKISIKYKLDINFLRLFESLLPSYDGLDIKLVKDFFFERLYKIFTVNPSIIKAVLASKEGNFYKISLKITALDNIVKSKDLKELSITFKRIANIISSVNEDSKKELKIKEELLSQDEEKTLYKMYQDYAKKEYNTYEEELDTLFSLKPFLDDFFAKVFVNCEDEKIKENRKNLIMLIYKSFKNIADIKELSI